MSGLPDTRYDKVSMAVHWITALLMIGMVFFGEELIEVEDGATGTLLPSLHVSIGIAILGLTLFRILWRMINPAPPLPASMAAWEVMASKVTHLLFYAVLIAVPLTGWLAFGEFVAEEPGMSGVTIFGMFPVPGAPSLFGGEAEDIHEIGSKVAMALIILHVLAALKHQFISRDGLMKRMSPH